MTMVEREHSPTAFATTDLIGGVKLGWTVPTGTSSRTGLDTSTATITQVAQTLKALIEDLHAATSTAGNGLIGT